MLVAVVGLLGLHDQLAIRQNEAHNLWAYPEMPSNGQPVDYQAAAAVVAANARPGDGIVYQTSDLNHYQVDTAMSYYLRGKAARWRSSRRRRRSRPTRCSPPTARTRRPASREPRGSGWSSSTTWPPTRSPRCHLPEEQCRLQVLGYQVQSMWQENGITVALLTVG